MTYHIRTTMGEIIKHARQYHLNNGVYDFTLCDETHFYLLAGNVLEIWIE